VLARVDQLLFGYREGHELLAASTPIDSRLQSILLPHTDARFEDESEHYLIGIPVPEAGRYLLARVWPAPELPRPGAVWAHAFLMNLSSVPSIDPLVLVESFRRPQPGEIEPYTVPLELSSGTKVPISAPMNLMETLCLVAYGENSLGGVVLWREPIAAEGALLALWRALPVQPRGEFSFRTRGRARTGRSPYAVQVAATLGGRSDSDVLSVIDPATLGQMPAWAIVLAEASLNSESRAAAFIAENATGPTDSRILASIWPALVNCQPDEVLFQLAANYPDQSQQTSLKLALFGELKAGHTWWDLPELDRLKAALELSSNLLRGSEFALSDRLDHQWRSAGRQQMLAWLDSRHRLPADSAGLVLEAAISHLDAAEIASRANDRELLTQALSRRSEIFGEPEFWTVLASAEVEVVLGLAAPSLSSPAVISALIESGNNSLSSAALNHGADALLLADTLARRHPTDLSRFASIFSGQEEGLLIALQQGSRMKPDTLVLAAAIFGPADVARISLRRWLAGARAAHDRSDNAALGASMSLLCTALGSDGKTARKILIESFGPVHAGLEAGVINRNLTSWDALEQRLPGRSTDKPAKRLRQALVESMEKSEWSTEDLKRALGPAGPQAERLIRLVPKKSSLRRLVESTLVDLVSPFRG
jgi:hypothetical protein